MQTRRRIKGGAGTGYKPGPNLRDESLPFGGKVVLAKRKVSQGNFALFVEFYVTWFYANTGHDHAQHLVGQKYLQGYGVEKNYEKAFYWFRKAADQGHPHASYNLAIGHLKGFETGIKQGEVRRLVHHAANKGISEAKSVLSHLCPHGNGNGECGHLEISISDEEMQTD